MGVTAVGTPAPRPVPPLHPAPAGSARDTGARDTGTRNSGARERPVRSRGARLAGAARRLRPLVPLALLALLVHRLGLAALLSGVRAVQPGTLAAAAAIALLTTVCAAWRWTLVARGMGLRLRLPWAVAAYYRSQFLNGVLPGGVLGDVHRALGHGRAAGDLARGARAVAWERVAGQVVQVAAAGAVLLVVPSPVPRTLAGLLLVAGLLAAAAGAGLPRYRLPRWLRTADTDLRTAVLARSAWPGIVAASAVVVAGHTATFLLAARAAGVGPGAGHLLPLALLVLLAAAIPLNLAGFGPREGVAAWAFAAAGLGAAQGAAVAVTYGVLSLVATLPGALVPLVGGGPRRG
jgi:uncharacterized membrane protein YbhN (UPF0104 family)